MPSKPAANPQAGFTLLELLVGMVLLALAMALVSQAGRLLNLEGARRDHRLIQQHALLQAQEILSGQLRSALPAPSSRGHQDPPPLLGDSRQMTFLSSLSLRQPSAPGLWQVTCRLEPAGGGRSKLILTQLPAGLEAASAGRAPAQAGLTLTLVEGLTQAQFTYLALERPGRPQRISARWGEEQQRNKLPLAVLLEAKLGGQNLSWRLPLACAQPESR
jgi:prepilin-type N-terminal cleavage/methylation domain-containing protein